VCPGEPVCQCFLLYRQTCREKKEEADEIRQALEDLVEDLEKVADLVQTWPEKYRKESELYKEIKVSFQAVQYWAEQIARKETPKKLQESLLRKRARLSTAVQLEILKQAQQAQGKLDDIKGINEEIKEKLALDDDTPEGYYTAGKSLFVSGDWIGARIQFTKYNKLFKKKGKRCSTT